MLDAKVVHLPGGNWGEGNFAADNSAASLDVTPELCANEHTFLPLVSLLSRVTIPGRNKRNICGPRVRSLRNARDWSQSKLAAACQIAGWDVTRDTIALIEAQRRWVGDFELRTLARVLDVSLEDLVPSGQA